MNLSGYIKKIQLMIAFNLLSILPDSSMASVLVASEALGPIRQKVLSKIEWFRTLPIGANGPNTETDRIWLEHLVNLKDSNAAAKMVRGLKYGIDGFKKNPKKAERINEKWVGKESAWAINNKIDRVIISTKGPEARTGPYSFVVSLSDRAAKNARLNEPDLKQLNDMLVAIGDERAIARELERLRECGCQSDNTQIKNFIEKWTSKGSSTAATCQMYSLLDGTNGFEKDHDKAKKLIEYWVTKSHPIAVNLKFDDLWYKYGYPQLSGDQIKSLIEEGIAKGYRWAMEKKLKGLIQGTNGYQRDVEQANELVEQWVDDGHQWLAELKIEGLAKGGSNHLFSKNIPLLWEYTQKYDKKYGSCIYPYLQAAGYWLGIWDLEKNQKKAQEIMKKYNIEDFNYNLFHWISVAAL